MLPLLNLGRLKERPFVLKLRRQIRNYPIRGRVLCPVILGKRHRRYDIGYGKYSCLTRLCYASAAHRYTGSTTSRQKYKSRFHQTRPICRRRLGIYIGHKCHVVSAFFELDYLAD